MPLPQTSSSTLRVLLLAGIVGFGPLWAQTAQGDIRTQAIVTVYSDGKVMATYHAEDEGRMDNGCYVFHIRKGVRDVEVRVCGTFTVEQVR
ncbi:MAG: hypothetical protein P8Y64_08195 [Gammaproteobacteria bacterium]|jgi:hypothetical protein